MANITRGFTFSSGDLVTAAKLHSLVDSASISGLTQAALASSSNLITSGGTAPGSPAVGQAWWDTSTTEADGNGILKIYDGTRWQSASKNQEQSLINRSGGSLTHGDVVVLDTSADNSVTTTTTEASTDFLGIAATGTDGASTIGDQSEGRFVQSGLVVVNTTGTVARGDYLGTSGTVKLAKSLGASPAKGAFGRAIKNTATDKWLVLMSGGVSKLGETAYPVHFFSATETGGATLDSGSNSADYALQTLDTFTIDAPPIAQNYSVHISGYFEVYEMDTSADFDIKEVVVKHGTTTLGTLAQGSLLNNTSLALSSTEIQDHLWPFSGTVHVPHSVSGNSESITIQCQRLSIGVPGGIQSTKTKYRTNIHLNASQWKVV